MGGGLGEPGRRTAAAGAGLVAGQPPGHDHDGGPVDTSCAKKDTGPASRQIDQIVLLLGADAGSFTDPDGFAWEAASRRDVRSCV